jgi:hypothetical protein
MSSGSYGDTTERSLAENQTNGSPSQKAHLEILANSQGIKRSSSTDRRNLSHQSTAGGSSLAPDNNIAETASSTTSLLHHDDQDDEAKPSQDDDTQPKSKGILARAKSKVSGNEDTADALQILDDRVAAPAKNRIRFDIAQEGTRSALLMRARMGHSQLREGIGSVLKHRLTDGAIVKMEKMLVRVDATNNAKLSNEYDENSSQGVVSATRKKWREYMIVVRQNRSKEGLDFVLQAYKTRVCQNFRKISN